MIPYSVNLIGNPRDPSQPKKAYARVQINKTYDVQEFAAYIARHNSKYDQGDIYAVLETVSRHLRYLLQNGNKVSLGNLGSFYPSISSEGANSLGEFSENNIRNLRTNWEPPQHLANMMEGATFSQVLTRDMNTKIMKLSAQVDSTEQLAEQIKNLSKGDAK